MSITQLYDTTDVLEEFAAYVQQDKIDIADADMMTLTEGDSCSPHDKTVVDAYKLLFRSFVETGVCGIDAPDANADHHLATQLISGWASSQTGCVSWSGDEQLYTEDAGHDWGAFDAEVDRLVSSDNAVYTGQQGSVASRRAKAARDVMSPRKKTPSLPFRQPTPDASPRFRSYAQQAAIGRESYAKQDTDSGEESETLIQRGPPSKRAVRSYRSIRLSSGASTVCRFRRTSMIWTNQSHLRLASDSLDRPPCSMDLITLRQICKASRPIWLKMTHSIGKRTATPSAKLSLS